MSIHMSMSVNPACWGTSSQAWKTPHLISAKNMVTPSEAHENTNIGIKARLIEIASATEKKSTTVLIVYTFIDRLTKPRIV